MSPTPSNEAQQPPAGKARHIALSWLSAFSKFLTAGDVDGLLSTFHPNGYLRDILVFTWNNRTLQGHPAISLFLTKTLAHARIINIALDERQFFTPIFETYSPSVAGVSTGFTFETPIAQGQGYARLSEDAQGTWKALSVFFMVDYWKGHAESGPESGVYGGHTLTWNLVKEERQRKIESCPYVIIVGAGQTGLNIGARLKRYGVPTLIVERNARVGDNWRQRYSTLVLHSPRPHNSLNFQDFPETWPIYSPRDKLADWLEQYAITQDLVVWTKSTLQPVPRYDTVTGRWTCIIQRGDTTVLLHPAHIIIACGTIGKPNIPQIPTASLFEGEIFHASTYQTGMPFAGKRVIVIGAGNTSADVCQDLVFCGAKSVMMVQRSETTVISCEKMTRSMLVAWPQDVPIGVSDFKYASMPWGLRREFTIETLNSEGLEDMDRVMLDKLREKGLNLAKGPKDGSGQVFLVVERFGGYWVDVGVADCIHENKIVIKSGVEIAKFTSETVVFDDGAEHEADTVIYATGYEDILESFKPLFGEEVISKTPSIWGLDDEQELKGSYRPSGQPGLWYAAGNFYFSRFYSKQLALQIKAVELGFMPQ